jgi:uncharacterized protein
VPTTDPDRAQEALGHEECLALLGHGGIGRLTYTQGALPAVRPVSFAVGDEDVLIPVAAGSGLVDAVHGAIVAFQTDCYDDARTGWSVTVVGPARVLGLAHAADPPPRLPLGLHPPAPCGCVLAVRLGLVQGWRTTLPLWAEPPHRAGGASTSARSPGASA